MALLLDVVSWILLMVGGAAVFTGGLGALRLPDFYTRMHAASLTESMGTVLMLIGIALQVGWSLPAGKLITIMLFLLLTSPTAAYALANAARLSGLRTAGAAAVATGSDR